MVQGLRAAVYARLSSEEQVEGYSLDAQRRAFRTLVEGRGWTVFQEYLEGAGQPTLTTSGNVRCSSRPSTMLWPADTTCW